MKEKEKAETMEAFYRLILKWDKKIRDLEYEIIQLNSVGVNERTEVSNRDTDEDEIRLSRYKISEALGTTPRQKNLQKKYYENRLQKKIVGEWHAFKKRNFIQKIALALLYIIMALTIVGFGISLLLFGFRIYFEIKDSLH